MAVKNLIAGGIGFTPGTVSLIFTRGLGVFGAILGALRKRKMFSKIFIGKVQ